MLGLVARLGLATFALFWAFAGSISQAVADEAPTNTAPDVFFAGNVVEFSSDRITVERTVLGKTEHRTFWITSATKVEGKLAPKVRVTVGYVSDENGDTATRIVVRPATPAAPQSKKK